MPCPFCDSSDIVFDTMCSEELNTDIHLCRRCGRTFEQDEGEADTPDQRIRRLEGALIMLRNEAEKVSRRWSAPRLNHAIEQTDSILTRR